MRSICDGILPDTQDYSSTRETFTIAYDQLVYMLSIADSEIHYLQDGGDRDRAASTIGFRSELLLLALNYRDCSQTQNRPKYFILHRQQLMRLVNLRMTLS